MQIKENKGQKENIERNRRNENTLPVVEQG